MPYGDRTYIERLSKDLNKYTTVREPLQGLNTKILIKKSSIEKLAVIKSNLEAFLFLLVAAIYFYSIILNAQVQIQKNLRIVLLISNFNYLPLLCIVTKPAKFVRSKFNIEQNNNKKKRKEKETKTAKTRRKVIDNRSRPLEIKEFLHNNCAYNQNTFNMEKTTIIPKIKKKIVSIIHLFILQDI